MPRKIRQLKSDLRRAGFMWRPAKGSHTVWFHPRLIVDEVTLSGKDGDDAEHYQERAVRQVLSKLQTAEKRNT